MRINDKLTSNQIASAASNAPDGQSVGDRPTLPPESRTQISAVGRLFSGLSQLAEREPSQFRSVAAAIAERLRSAEGAQRTESYGAKLAQRLEAAAEAGSMSAFQWPSSADPGAPASFRRGHDAANAQRAFWDSDEGARDVLEKALELVPQRAAADSGSGASLGDGASARMLAFGTARARG
jgi:hypothetical protein